MSHHQGSIDFAAVKGSGVLFALCKATESQSVDGMFDENHAKSAEAGLLRGAYHFARPADSPGADQARFFVDTVKAVPGDLPLALDLEDSGGVAAED